MAEKADKRDRAMIWVLFQAFLRRSEAAALEWRDVEAAKGGLRIGVRKSKTNQDGGLDDIRFVKAEAARALLATQPDEPNPDASVFGMSPEHSQPKVQGRGRPLRSASHGALGAGHLRQRTHAARRVHHRTDEIGRLANRKDGGHYASGVTDERNATAKYL